MATYQEIWSLRSDSSLLARFIIAMEISLARILSETKMSDAQGARSTLARRVFLPAGAANQVQSYADACRRASVVLDSRLQNEGMAVSDEYIQSLTDAWVTAATANGWFDP